MPTKHGLTDVAATTTTTSFLLTIYKHAALFRQDAIVWRDTRFRIAYAMTSKGLATLMRRTRSSEQKPSRPKNCHSHLFTCPVVGHPTTTNQSVDHYRTVQVQVRRPLWHQQIHRSGVRLKTANGRASNVLPKQKTFYDRKSRSPTCGKDLCSSLS